MPIRAVERLWPHGFVHAIKLRTKRGGGEDARMAALYVAKYVGKALEAEPGAHSYEVAQGHQPGARRMRVWGRPAARAWAIREMGGEVPAYEWTSSGEVDWRGPPVGFLSWAG